MYKDIWELRTTPETKQKPSLKNEILFQINGRRARGLYGRSDFRAAMNATENACSDIAEEDSFQSSSNHSHYPITIQLAMPNNNDVIQVSPFMKFVISFIHYFFLLFILLSFSMKLNLFFFFHLYLVREEKSIFVFFLKNYVDIKYS